MAQFGRSLLETVERVEFSGKSIDSISDSSSIKFKEVTKVARQENKFNNEEKPYYPVIAMEASAIPAIVARRQVTFLYYYY